MAPKKSQAPAASRARSSSPAPKAASPKSKPAPAPPKPVPESPSKSTPASSPSRTSQTWKKVPRALLEPNLKWTDTLALGICAFLGGRIVLAKFGAGSALLLFKGILSAELTALGGGSLYHLYLWFWNMVAWEKYRPIIGKGALISKFAIQNPDTQKPVLAGYALAALLYYLGFLTAFVASLANTALECLNMGILVCWAVAILLQKSVQLPGKIVLILFVLLPAAFLYSAGGGLLRDHYIVAEAPVALTELTYVPVVYGAVLAAVCEFGLTLGGTELIPAGKYTPYVIPVVAALFYAAGEGHLPNPFPAQVRSVVLSVVAKGLGYLPALPSPLR